MVNHRRGEISAKLNDRTWTLCLTLGALAELETHFKVQDLPELAEKLSDGKLSSADLIAILHAGLKGGGHDLALEDIAEMRCEEGTGGYAKIVAELLVTSFAALGNSSA